MGTITSLKGRRAPADAPGMVLVLQVLVLWVVLAAGAAAAVSLLLGRAHRLADAHPAPQAAPAGAPVALTA